MALREEERVVSGTPEDLTDVLHAVRDGDADAERILFERVYDELRRIAHGRIRREHRNLTLLQTNDLVHEAYLRLVGKDNQQSWENRGHFFAAAAEAMRRILVDIARRKMTVRHGGQSKREHEFRDLAGPGQTAEETIAINELLERFASDNPRQAQVAKMRLFLDMTLVEISHVVGYSADTAEADWAYARAWLKRELRKA